MANLKRITYKQKAAFRNIKQSCIPTIKKHQYRIIRGVSVTGDQPKEVISLYEYGTGRKCNKKSWPIYIAKSAEKWYPNESIIEHLLNRIGQVLGLNMAFSRLAIINDQIRFLSKYFLKSNNEELIHGAEIYAGYVSDLEFVKNIEAEGQARKYFSMQFTFTAIQSIFPENANDIYKELTKMLLFDALVGNNDRHFYNWAVIRNVNGSSNPVFSPVYDTARGLFWNEREEKIVDLWHDKERLNVFIKKYIFGSRPKIGWDGHPNLNHFELVELISKENKILDYEFIKAFFADEQIEKCFKMIDNEFNDLLSPERIELMKLCLKSRQAELKKI